MAVLAALLMLRPAAAEASGPLACGPGPDTAVVAQVTPDFNLMLADGRELQLVGVDPWRPTDDTEVAAARTRVAAWLEGRTIGVRPVAAAPDRWGRIAALAFAPDPDGAGTDMPQPATSLAETLVGLGFARARPDPRITGCWSALLGRERHARDGGLGLWAQARYAVLPADDRARLLAGTGAMAIVRGRIVRIVEGRARTYLSFGTRGRDDFALSITAPVLARWRAAGTDPATWRSREVEARGFLDDRFGLQIEMQSTDQITFSGR